MILDLNKVQELIDSEMTAWKISKDTGLSRNMVTTYKDGKDIKRMTIENGLKLQSYWEDIKKERAKMNVNDIDNKDYIWGFEQLGEFLDEENNFLERKEFEWWKELANSLAFLDDEGFDVAALETNELQDYIDIAKKHRGADRFSREALQNVYFDDGNGTYDLEFLVNGEKNYRQVQASDHPEAATNENYFDDKKVVNRIIMEIPED